MERIQLNTKIKHIKNNNKKATKKNPTTNLIKEWAEDLNRHFQRGQTDGQ